ncbi:MAG: tRNA lysidine(34) synthetase TilS [Kineosporiaceae bacterium]
MPGPAPTHAPTHAPEALAAVRHAVAEGLRDLDDGCLVIVACSGGADSLALAAGLAFLVDPGRPAGRRRELRTAAVVVDHAWSPGSAEVAERAAGQCRALGLGAGDPDAVRVRRVPGDGGRAGGRAGDPGGQEWGGPEAAARAARYALLEEEARERGAAAVLLGHTRDDQAETVLLGLARGSGTRSLAGMPAVRGPYRRPLLALPRASTRAACEALGLTPWEDPSNTDPDLTRARVRSALGTWREGLAAALGRSVPALEEALARSASIAREDADALDALAAQLFDAGRVAGAQDGPGEVTLDVTALAGEAPALRHRVLLAAARAVSARPQDVGREHVLAVAALLAPGASGGAVVCLPGGAEAVRGRGPGYGRLTLRPTGGPGGSGIQAATSSTEE